MFKIKYFGKHPDYIPKRQTQGSAGYDMYSQEDITLMPGESNLISTGFSIATDNSIFAKIESRSSMAMKKIVAHAGVIDSDYRGEIKVLLYNHSQHPFEIKVGDRIAQLILIRIYIDDPIIVESLEASDRGSGGFGSTGR